MWGSRLAGHRGTRERQRTAASSQHRPRPWPHSRSPLAFRERRRCDRQAGNMQSHRRARARRNQPATATHSPASSPQKKPLAERVSADSPGVRSMRVVRPCKRQGRAARAGGGVRPQQRRANSGQQEKTALGLELGQPVHGRREGGRDAAAWVVRVSSQAPHTALLPPPPQHTHHHPLSFQVLYICLTTRNLSTRMSPTPTPTPTTHHPPTHPPTQHAPDRRPAGPPKPRCCPSLSVRDTNM